MMRSTILVNPNRGKLLAVFAGIFAVLGIATAAPVLSTVMKEFGDAYAIDRNNISDTRHGDTELKRIETSALIHIHLLLADRG